MRRCTRGPAACTRDKPLPKEVARLVHFPFGPRRPIAPAASSAPATRRARRPPAPEVIPTARLRERPTRAVQRRVPRRASHAVTCAYPHPAPVITEQVPRSSNVCLGYATTPNKAVPTAARRKPKDPRKTRPSVPSGSSAKATMTAEITRMISTRDSMAGAISKRRSSAWRCEFLQPYDVAGAMRR